MQKVARTKAARRGRTVPYRRLRRKASADNGGWTRIRRRPGDGEFNAGVPPWPHLSAFICGAVDAEASTDYGGAMSRIAFVLLTVGLCCLVSGCFRVELGPDGVRLRPRPVTIDVR